MNSSFLQALESAVNAQNSGRTQEADRIYTALLEADPKHPHVNHNMGILGITAGQPEQASLYFKVALESDPTVEQFWISYVANLVSLNRVGSAKKIIKKAKRKGVNDKTLADLKNILTAPRADKELSIFQEPNSIDLQKLQNYMDQGEFEYLLRESNRLIQAFPNSAIIFNLRGGANRQLKRYDTALKDYSRAVEIKPNYGEAFFNLGNCYGDMGYLDLAIENFLRAIELEPQRGDFYMNLALIYKSQDKLKEALACYTKVLELDPKKLGIQENMGQLYLQIANYETAIEYLKLSGTPRANSLLLDCLYKLNEKSKFYSHLDYMEVRKEICPLLGALTQKAELKFGVKRDNLFCSEPLKYVYLVGLKDNSDFSETFVEYTNRILDEPNISFQSQYLLTNGDQTAGNFFASDDPKLVKIKRSIELEIENYREQFKDSDEGFIRCWPKSYILKGWIISMKSGGELSPHFHEEGWISGSVYINIPKNLENDAGNLVVTLDDEESKTSGNERSIELSTGDLCLFPSSLSHYTIPFESTEERIVVAFDVIPN